MSIILLLCFAFNVGCTVLLVAFVHSQFATIVACINAAIAGFNLRSILEQMRDKE